MNNRDNLDGNYVVFLKDEAFEVDQEANTANNKVGQVVDKEEWKIWIWVGWVVSVGETTQSTQIHVNTASQKPTFKTENIFGAVGWRWIPDRKNAQKVDSKMP